MLSLEETPRWIIFTAISSALCILGSLCVPLFSLMFRRASSVNSRLLNYGLSISAGSMITTSLYKMLPKMNEEDRFVIFIGFVLGVVISSILNFVVHAYTSESLVHCSHGSEHDNDSGSSPESREQVHAAQDQSTTEGAAIHNDHGRPNHETEQQPLQSQRPPLQSTNSASLRHKKSLIDIFARKSSNAGNCYGSTYCTPNSKASAKPEFDKDVVTCLGDTSKKALMCPENGIGYDLENLSMYRANFLKGEDPHEHPHHHVSNDSSSVSAESTSSKEEHHHHHTATPFSKLLSIGIQTCLVISLHKFPEGFIVFFTNKNDSDSKSFGMSIFLSLAIHNFIEGFAMTLPLYAAFKTKWHAILTTAVLGGGSQPLGALVGYLIFKKTGSQELHINFLLSITSGFLFVIGLQMFQTAIGFSDSHHHHREISEETDDEPHSLATTCLKWCCFGVVLILASGLFA
ncbi:LANO_0G04148g1_1 [Lachancea nothofagi CBS 11611]|uniref:LANO_0G04148g1_1 n=1 Tax=Lachancea nothofagi CBS 11611 TaxID=1266666 RepID=A0A1G4KG02_9SACH|nr:LANO_0G04148g1_1 [Lachancea nothofagi CBS 11611]